MSYEDKTRGDRLVYSSDCFSKTAVIRTVKLVERMV